MSSAADGLRLLADHLDTHPELNAATVNAWISAGLKPELLRPFMDGTEEELVVEPGGIVRMFGSVKVRLAVPHALTKAPPEPPRKLRTVAEILEAVS